MRTPSVEEVGIVCAVGILVRLWYIRLREAMRHWRMSVRAIADAPVERTDGSVRNPPAEPPAQPAYSVMTVVYTVDLGTGEYVMRCFGQSETSICDI